jgi:hypothetical protein
MKQAAPTQEQYENLDDAQRAEAYDLALEEANRIASQATRVAPYVIKRAKREYYYGYPSLRRTPAVGGLYRTNLSVLEMATNAELRAAGKDIVVMMDDGTAPSDRYGSKISPHYVVKSIDGQPILEPFKEPEQGRIINFLNRTIGDESGCWF